MSKGPSYRRPKQSYPLLKDPGDPEPELGLPGSIEQQLDMCEEGTLRGERIQHRERMEPKSSNRGDPLPVDELMKENFRLDLSEESREGDELTGDEHSSGFQGGEPEFQNQPHLSSGLPGHGNLPDIQHQIPRPEPEPGTLDLEEGLPAEEIPFETPPRRARHRTLHRRRKAV